MTKFLKLTNNISTNVFHINKAEQNSHAERQESNPFIASTKSRRSNNLFDSSIVNNLKKGISNDAFLTAALRCDPYAVKGMTSQIRIA